MRTHSPRIDVKFLQFLPGVMPRSRPAGAPVRREAGVTQERAHAGLTLLQDVLEAGRSQGVPRESSLAGRGGTPIRVLIAADDPEVRDTYERILQETRVSSDI